MTTTRHDFDSVDAKGRRLGCEVTIEFVPAWVNPGDDEHRWHADSHDAYWRFGPHATRDGSRFGAIPVRAWRRFATQAEATAHAERYLAGARKRAARASLTR